MPLNKRDYIRLPGRARKNFGLLVPGRQLLWLGADHLLIVDRSGYREQVKRVFFKDVQAITLNRTMAGLYAHLFLAAATLFFAIVVVTLTIQSRSVANSDLYDVFIGLSVIVMFILLCFWIPHAVFGPTAKCYLYTAVQAHELTALGRLRTARKVVHRLVEHIEGAQGAAGENIVAAYMERKEEARQRAVNLGGRPLVTDPTVASAPASALRHEHGTAHFILFAMMLVGAFSSFVDPYYQSGVKVALDSLSILIVLAVAIWALVRQRQSDVGAGLKVLTMIVPIYLILLMMVAFVFGVLNFENADMTQPYQDPREWMGEGTYNVMVVGSGVVDLVVGAAGLALLARHRRRYAKRTPPSPEPAVE